MRRRGQLDVYRKGYRLFFSFHLSEARVGIVAHLKTDFVLSGGYGTGNIDFEHRHFTGALDCYHIPPGTVWVRMGHDTGANLIFPFVCFIQFIVQARLQRHGKEVADGGQCV